MTPLFILAGLILIAAGYVVLAVLSLPNTLLDSRDQRFQNNRDGFHGGAG